MRLATIELVTFRSWKSVTVRFDDRVTALIGPNGSGKTSILEGAWYASSLGSHRTSTDAALVMSSALWPSPMTSWPRSRAAIMKSRPSMPPAPATRMRIGSDRRGVTGS